MRKILLILAVTTLNLSVKAQNVTYLFGMNSTGQPVINSVPIPTVTSSGSYNDLINKPTIITNSAGFGVSYVGGAITNTLPDQTVTLTAGNGITVSGTYPNFTIGIVQPTINNVPGRAVNSNFTINTTKSALAIYSVTAQVTNPLLAGTSAGTVNLEYSTNAGSTWSGALQVGNSSNVGITVTVQLNNGQTTQVIGIIPANALVRLRTTTSGTATITYVGGQEIVY